MTNRATFSTSRAIKLWLGETSTYNFSVNLSMGLSSAFLIKLLGYGPAELGFITSIRMLAIAISMFPAAVLVEGLREKRKTTWLISGAISRIGWCLIPISLLFPKPFNLVYLSALVFTAQFASGICSVASLDVVGDLIPGTTATEVFSRASRYTYLSTAVSQLAGLAAFIAPIDTLLGYVIAYIVALAFATVSTFLLYLIPDPGKAEKLEEEGNLFKRSIRVVASDPKLRKYLLVISMFNFAVGIPAPFWDYLVMSVTGGRELFIPLKNMANLFVKVACVKWWKSNAERRGLRKVLVRGMAFTSLVPLLYAEASTGTEVIFAEAVSGFVWTPVDLGTSIYNVYLPPSTTRPVYISAVNLFVNSAFSVATTVGTIVAVSTGSVFPTLMISAMLRGLTAAIAHKSLPEVEDSPSFVQPKGS
ncbi:MAG: MFS transporter [Desulfurococcaceae archaeon]